MRRLLFLLVCAGMFCGVYAYGVAQENAVLQKIDFQKKMQDSVAVSFVVQGTLQRKIFMLHGEKPRLVVDFLDTVYHGDSKIAVHDSKLFQGIRIGYHPKPQMKTRVVIDLVTEPKVTWQEQQKGQELTLVVRRAFDSSKVVEQDEKMAAISLPARQQKKPESVVSLPEETGFVEEKKAQNMTVVLPSTRQMKPDPFARPFFESLDTPSAAPIKKIKTEQNIQSLEITSAGSLSSDKLVPAFQKQTIKKPAFVKPQKISPQKNSVLATQQPAAASLFEVTFKGFENEEERVLFKLDDFHPPIVSAIVGATPRVVCDFYKMQTFEKVLGVHKVSGRYVKNIRVAQHENPGKVRVVLDLVPGNDYALHQFFFNEDNLFVLAVKKSDDISGRNE